MMKSRIASKVALASVVFAALASPLAASAAVSPLSDTISSSVIKEEMTKKETSADKVAETIAVPRRDYVKLAEKYAPEKVAEWKKTLKELEKKPAGKVKLEEDAGKAAVMSEPVKVKLSLTDETFEAATVQKVEQALDKAVKVGDTDAISDCLDDLLAEFQSVAKSESE
ncbi:hypothetical protein M3223_19405 [Paenibacillus pasadenensis]|uniref:hypothetical protein n=1 Tax=Paenibacillus pasadenensis TaxID=217090 RepID=UPI00203E4DC8|nr:hypothetical protein [Paenibacillus pasadenensis]MCM3749524.1 hypothetical protein [Paenibacillus pasadenensis]